MCVRIHTLIQSKWEPTLASSHRFLLAIVYLSLLKAAKDCLTSHIESTPIIPKTLLFPHGAAHNFLRQISPQENKRRIGYYPHRRIKIIGNTSTLHWFYSRVKFSSYPVRQDPGYEVVRSHAYFLTASTWMPHLPGQSKVSLLASTQCMPVDNLKSFTIMA
jgi:hypothetical protein